MGKHTLRETIERTNRRMMVRTLLCLMRPIASVLNLVHRRLGLVDAALLHKLEPGDLCTIDGHTATVISVSVPMYDRMVELAEDEDSFDDSTTISVALLLDDGRCRTIVDDWVNRASHNGIKVVAFHPRERRKAK